MGSEMCIRDRVDVGLRRRRRGQHRALAAVELGLGLVPASAVGEVCLLYTSDAADERSV